MQALSSTAMACREGVEQEEDKLPRSHGDADSSRSRKNASTRRSHRLIGKVCDGSVMLGSSHICMVDVADSSKTRNKEVQ